MPSKKLSQSDQDLHQRLEAIYVDPKTGKAPDLKSMELGRRSHVGKIVALGVVGLAVALGAMWFGGLHPDQWVEAASPIELSIDGPGSIALGKEVSYTIDYRNRGTVAIDQADIRIAWPDEFVVTKLEPTPTDAKVKQWEVSRLEIGAHGVIHVNGVFIGALGGHSTVQVSASDASHRPALQSKSIDYVDSLVESRVNLPEKIIAGDPVTLGYDVKQAGDRPLQNTWLALTLPTGFQLDPSSLKGLVTKPLDQGIYLSLGTLAPNTTSSVRVVGSFSPTSFGDMAFAMSVGRFGVDGSFLPMHQKQATVPVLAGDFTLRLVANGSSVDQTMVPGAPLHVSLNYQNTALEAIKQANIRLEFESWVDGKSATGTSLLDWSQLVDEAHGATSTRTRVQSLRYDQTQLPELSDLPPQQEGTIDLTLPTLMAATGTHQAIIVLRAIGLAPTIGGTKVNREVRSSPLTLTYRTDARLASELRYFSEEGAPLGRGPLPLKAATTTVFRVFWSIDKHLHDLDHVSVTGTLPRVASWIGKPIGDLGSVTYATSTKQIVWMLDRVPANKDHVEVSFEIGITPEKIDVGRFASALSDAQAQWRDSQTGEILTDAAAALSTDASTDEGMKGKGVVR